MEGVMLLIQIVSVAALALSESPTANYRDGTAIFVLLALQFTG
jgi:hypothetical protein